MKTVSFAGRSLECVSVKPIRVLQFLEKVEVVDSGCWEWRGYVNDRGYGVVSYGAKPTYAYKFSWLAFRGTSVEDTHIHHACENKLCVNPDHLELLTPRAHQGQHHHSEVPESYFDGSSCKNGHPRTPENTYVWEGHPACRRCHADNTNRYYHENKGPSEHKKDWTRCINGHEFTPENTYIRKATARRAETRRCRICMLAEQKAAYQRKREQKLVKAREYYQKNRDEILEKKRARVVASAPA